ncbi:hypothetical protein RND71_005900 [Anisodus tanguticus]|uniref:Uncharacterized protein n=1 Tax=Anisodus tanguticus TaxID=243964 RepID=A0AAE1SPW7_9SOLA|nr:hypothetical protein RND71_005900 [Anisodus tanguticus]
MSWNGLKSECPGIIQKLKASRFDCFIKPTGNYIPVIVREFYATYGEILNSKRGRRHAKALIEPLGFVTIGGVSVDIRAQKINNFYFRKEGEGEDDFSVKHTDYDENIKIPDDQTQNIEIIPITSVATSSTPVARTCILAHGMRLIRLVEAKVTKLVKKFLIYVKEAIEIALVPHKENLEARQSTSELDSNEGDDPLANARSIVRAARIPPDELREQQRDQDTTGASSSLTPPTHALLPPSVGPIILLDTSPELAPVLEIKLVDQIVATTDLIETWENKKTKDRQKIPMKKKKNKTTDIQHSQSVERGVAAPTRQ